MKLTNRHSVTRSVKSVMGMPERVDGPELRYECPYCDDHPPFHMNINVVKGVWNCWRCGKSGRIGELLRDRGGRFSSPSFNTDTTDTYINIVDSSELKEDKERSSSYYGDKTYSSIPGYVPINPITGGWVDKQVMEYVYRRCSWPSWAPIGKSKAEVELRRGFKTSLELRAIFPIFTQHGTLVSWQARDVMGTETLKDINAPRSSGWTGIGNVIWARPNATARKIVLVEGIIDAAQKWPSGFEGVALMGSNLTEGKLHQLEIMKNQVIVLMLDGDVGVGASVEKALKIKDRVGCPVKVVDWGTDTDEDPASLNDQNRVLKVKNAKDPISLML